MGFLKHPLELENMTANTYSDMLTTSEFWDKIDAENILIFQTDSAMCKKPKYDIEYYIKGGYGYIGAPIKHEIDVGKKSAQNGGFSFRKKSLMIKAIKTKKRNENTFPEDMWFSVLKKDITNPAPFDIANSFSIETIFNEQPFGFHKIWEYNNDLNKLYPTCPEIKNIFNK